MKQLTKDEITAKIEEYCELSFTKLTKRDLNEMHYSFKDNIATEDEDEYADPIEEVKVVEDGVNITQSPETKVKHCEKECPDCKCKVKGRVLNHRWIERGNKKYWRHHCITCSKVASPWTGKYNISAQGSAIMYTSYERETLNNPHGDSQNNKWKK